MSNELKVVSENPDGIQMIKSYLETHGFGGLYTDECGCELSDLMPCGGDFAVHCQAKQYSKWADPLKSGGKILP